MRSTSQLTLAARRADRLGEPGAWAPGCL